MSRRAGERLVELLGAAAANQLVAVLEEEQRRVQNGSKPAKKVLVTIELEERTGAVSELVIPRRYRRGDSPA